MEREWSEAKAAKLVVLGDEIDDVAGNSNEDIVVAVVAIIFSFTVQNFECKDF